MPTELMRTLHFTEADLEANRAGIISQRQRRGLWLRWVAGCLMVPFVGCTVLIIQRISLPIPFDFSDIFLLAISLVILAFVGRRLTNDVRRYWLAFGRDLRVGVVEYVQGEMLKEERLHYIFTLSIANRATSSLTCGFLTRSNRACPTRCIISHKRAMSCRRNASTTSHRKIWTTPVLSVWTGCPKTLRYSFITR